MSNTVTTPTVTVGSGLVVRAVLARIEEILIIASWETLNLEETDKNLDE